MDTKTRNLPGYYPYELKMRLLRVANLIDRDRGEWNMDMVNSIFLPVDTEAVSSIPLCSSWPSDRLTWNFSSSGELTMKSTYHLILQCQNHNTVASSSTTMQTF